jgi:bacillithiol system protein YtxJ
MNASREISLPSDPAEAVAALRAASAETDVVVFKKSPICPVSTRAEFEFKTWLKGVPESSTTRYAMIDVIAEKPLARGLTAELGVDHQSPQALWFSKGELAWHDSHGSLTASRFAAGATA